MLPACCLSHITAVQQCPANRGNQTARARRVATSALDPRNMTSALTAVWLHVSIALLFIALAACLYLIVVFGTTARQFRFE